ncbi:MAG: imelysin family protein [Nannocystaceae bacterium]|nr:peptidase, imelysin family protein [bacterium]
MALSLGVSACGDDSSSADDTAADTDNTTDPTGATDDPTGADSSGGDTEGAVAHDLDLMRQVLETNADIAFAAYSDSVTTAQDLAAAIDTLVADPSEANLQAAKDAWLVSREPYGQTEVYRFRASPIDDTDYDAGNGEDGPEGDINAWPLGEGLIDYVVTGSDFGDDQVNVTDHSTGVEGPIPENNIINSPGITIDAALLSNTATADDEHDVIAGYHAIEFLLWGQDLNADGSADTLGSRDATPGQRPVTDFATDDTCTSGETANGSVDLCRRRGQYLQVAVAKLIADLESVRDGWADGAEYRTAFTTVDDIDAAKGKFLEILVGMGTLSEGELGGERMQISLSANSQEDEHSCFSDNTHRDIWLNAEGVQNSYRGEYAGYDSTLDGSDDQTGNAVSGYGLDDYLTDIGAADLEAAVSAALAETETHYRAIDAAARGGTPVDVMIQDAGGEAAAPMRDTIVSLNAQSAQIANIAVDLDIGSADDVVDPGASECDTTNPTAEC